MSSVRMAVVCGLLAVLVVLAACGPAPEQVVVRETAIAAGTVTVARVAVATTEPEPTEPPDPEPNEPVPTETAPATVSDPEREGLWYPVSEVPETLDLYEYVDDQTTMFVAQCLEGLYEFRADGAIEPVGATGFEVSDDGRVYTIKLRDDVVWSDGEPVVAQHYVDGIFRQLEGESDAWELYDIEGAEPYDTGEATDPATVGIRAVDDHVLEIRLAEPAPYFETVLPTFLFYPIRQDLMDALGAKWTDPANYVCNGAYHLEAWVPGDRVVYVKNPDYWNADQVSIERITFTLDADPMASYENDQLHAISGGGILMEAADYIAADPVLSQEMQVLTSSPGVKYLGLNTHRPPTDDARVRKALALAIDHEAIYDELLMVKGWEPPACTIPPNVMGHQPRGTCGHLYDPEKARALLAEAGYPDGAGVPPLHLWVTWGGGFSEGFVRMASEMWEETLGITSEVHAVEWTTLLDFLEECRQSPEALAACEFNLYYMGWSFDYVDPQNTLEVLFAPDSTYQYTGWQNERYEALLALAATEYDRARRTEYYKEADKILAEEQAVIIPALYGFRPTLVKEDVTYEYPPDGAVRFKNWSLP